MRVSTGKSHLWQGVFYIDPRYSFNASFGDASARVTLPATARQAARYGGLLAGNYSSSGQANKLENQIPRRVVLPRAAATSAVEGQLPPIAVG